MVTSLFDIAITWVKSLGVLWGIINSQITVGDFNISVFSFLTNPYFMGAVLTIALIKALNPL